MWTWNESAGYALWIGVAIKSMAVLGAAWFMALLLRRKSASARHLVWTAAFAALLALPVLSILLPALRVPISRIPLPPGVVFAVTAASNPTPVSTAMAQRSGSPLASTAWKLDWRWSLLFLWAAGATAGFVQMFVGWAAVWRARRTAGRVDDRDLGSLTTSLGITRDVDMLQAGKGAMPMTFGLFRPVVFMPADAMEWPAERRRVVLLHELAHVRRGDIATHLLGRCALNLHWWNPLAWTAWREFLKERERATDDLVLGAGARASEYASHLLEIARTMQSPNAIGWAAVAMVRPSQLEDRVTAILDSGRNRKTQGRAAAWVAAALAIGISAPLAALRAQDNVPQSPLDVEATIRAATSSKDPRMLDNAAKAAALVRDYDLARKLLESSLSIRESVSGGQSLEYGQGLINLGKLERSRGRLNEAEALYIKAASVLGDRPEAATALIDLGTIALSKKNFEEALEDFQKAQRVGPESGAAAMMWMASTLQQQKKSADVVESLYRKSIALQPPGSQGAITAMELFAQFLRQQGREEEANSMQGQALAARRQAARTESSPPDPGPNVYRVGDGVSPPQVLSKVDPEYTEEARAAQYQGTAVVSVEIGTDGVAHNIRMIRSLGLGLEDKAVESIRQWKFKPGLKDGQQVAVLATIEINWRLQ